MKYFVYCRKSSEGNEKQALSLQAQERELKEYAVNNNLKIVRIFNEAKSAKTPNKREQFNIMLDRIQSGDADAILCWHTNRLSRNAQESGVIMQLLNDGIILEIRTPQKTIDSANANDILLGVEFGSNSQFSKDLSLNTKRGIREKIILGQWPSLAPAFYINYGRDNKNKNIQPDPANAKFYPLIVKEIIKNRLNVLRVVDLLKSWGVKNKSGKYFGKSTLHRILRDPIYYGLLKYADYPEKTGGWEPLIDKNTWLKLQEVLNDHEKPIKTKWNYPYSRLIKCSRCGLTITPYTKVKKSGKAYTYYSCTKRNGNCGNVPITESELEDLIIPFVQKIRFSDEQIQKLKKKTLQYLEDEYKFEIRKKDEITTKLNDCSEQQDRLLTMRIDGEITKEEFKIKKDKIKDDIEKLEELNRDLNFNRENIRRELELFFEELKSFETTFTNGLSEDKRRVVFKLTESITLNDKKLGWNFKKAYQALIEVVSDENSVTWGQLLDSILNFEIDFKVNVRNITKLLEARSVI
jgi:DNA invertase Pin-like site-specific DNA recombinase